MAEKEYIEREALVKRLKKKSAIVNGCGLF